HAPGNPPRDRGGQAGGGVSRVGGGGADEVSQGVAPKNSRTRVCVLSGSSNWGTWPHSGYTSHRAAGSALLTWRTKDLGTSQSRPPKTKYAGRDSEGRRSQKPVAPWGSSR